MKIKQYIHQRDRFGKFCGTIAIEVETNMTVQKLIQELKRYGPETQVVMEAPFMSKKQGCTTKVRGTKPETKLYAAVEGVFIDDDSQNAPYYGRSHNTEPERVHVVVLY